MIILNKAMKQFISSFTHHALLIYYVLSPSALIS